MDPHDLRAAALAMHQTGKPLGYCVPRRCYRIFAFPLRITIGTDLDTADVVGEEMGAEHDAARSTRHRGG